MTTPNDLPSQAADYLITHLGQYPVKVERQKDGRVAITLHVPVRINEERCCATPIVPRLRHYNIYAPLGTSIGQRASGCRPCTRSSQNSSCVTRM